MRNKLNSRLINSNFGISMGWASAKALISMANRAKQVYDTVKPYYQKDRSSTQPIIQNPELPERNIREYKIKSGDVLGRIAKDYNITLDDLLKLNPQVQDPNKVSVGQSIKLPQRNIREYTIKQGDTLSKIAKDNNITLNKLLSMNHQISNPNIVYVGQKINLTGESQDTWRKLDDVRQSESNLTNEQAIHQAKHDQNYVIVDKVNKTGTVFNPDGRKIYSFPISTGASNNDFNTITYVNDLGTIRDGVGNMSTPAGITMITGTGNYHGYPSFTRGRVGSDMQVKDDIASSFHYGNTAYGSNGCVRMDGDALNRISSYINPGTMVYTLPEKEGSRFVLKDGNLSFVADNPYGETEGPNQYWDDYNVTINKTYQPLRIEIDENKSPNSWWTDQVSKYSNAIEQNKQSIMHDLNLDSATYNTLAKLAMGIAQQETQFGTSQRKIVKDIIGNDFISIIKKLRGNNSYNSHGLTQMKLSGDNKELKSLYNKYGITEQSLDNPNSAAIATILRLAHMYNTEVKGRSFRDLNNNQMNLDDVLLYKWMGRNKWLTNGTATPEQNSYLKNVKDYSNWFNYYISQQI